MTSYRIHIPIQNDSSSHKRNAILTAVVFFSEIFRTNLQTLKHNILATFPFKCCTFIIIRIRRGAAF